MSYREAVAYGLAQEMARDENVYLIGEDVAAAGGVFKTTPGLLERFGPRRVRDTPISEEAIVGAAMGAAMNGLRPVAEIMFSDFLATCWDLVANQIAKARYMTDGQVALPLVIRTANGAGVRFGAQHSQSLENWAMSVPGLKVVAPSTPRDVVALLAASIRDPDPVIFFEHKGLFASKGPVPEGEVVGRLGRAAVLRSGSDATILALAAMVPRALGAAEELSRRGIEATVVDLRCLVPLDTRTILAAVAETNRAPFDLVEAEQELVGGFHTEYSGIRFAMFFLAEYINILSMCAIAATLFFGGWNGPTWEGVVPGWVSAILPVVWLMLKSYVLVVAFFWIRATLPRLRYDQLMTLGWKRLIPASMLWLVISTVVIGFRQFGLPFIG